MSLAKELSKIICGNCGSTDELDVSNTHLHFPYRWAYTKGNITPHKCTTCHSDSDIIIFGERLVTLGFNPKLYTNPNVIENNHIYYSKKAQS